jgi:sugar fermentation stimulation protein A
MSEFVYTYPPLFPGTLLKRYKRFLADIKLDNGEEITVHCANPGKMLGLSTPGSRVMVSLSSNAKRKLPYSLELVAPEDNPDTWVGVNTSLPNQVIKLALAARLFPGLGDYQIIKPEVVYGRDRKSRVDFFLTGSEETTPIYLEVKNVTWAQGQTALFPDAVTTRGQKHLLELVDVMETHAARAVALFFISRSDCETFAPGDAADPIYGKLLRAAIAKGLEILPCRFELTPEGVRYLGLAQVEF